MIGSIIDYFKKGETPILYHSFMISNFIGHSFELSPGKASCQSD